MDIKSKGFKAYTPSQSAPENDQALRLYLNKELRNIANAILTLFTRVESVRMYGEIVLYSGALVDLDSDWQECDGTNGTPDLRTLQPIPAVNYIMYVRQ